MDVHKRVYHEGLLFGCDYCSHKARRKSEFLAHDAFGHLKENVIKCNTCEKKFHRTTYLKIHMQSHTGEKPYQCDKYYASIQASHLKSRLANSL